MTSNLTNVNLTAFEPGADTGFAQRPNATAVPNHTKYPLEWSRWPARRAAALSVLLVGLLLAGSSMSDPDQPSAFSRATGEQPPAPWHVHGFPGGNKPVSRFDLVTLDGERVLRVVAEKSYGMLRHDLPGLMAGPGTTLRWRWRLEQPLLDADLRRKAGDDVPLKVCALFDLELGKLGFIERSFLLAARRVSREYIPAETLCYVWDHQLAVGTELPNPFTRRVRYVVLNSGERQLGTWLAHERDLVADFLRAFGDETDTVPPLVGLAIGADADNTGGSSLAYVGDLVLKQVPPAPAKP